VVPLKAPHGGVGMRAIGVLALISLGLATGVFGADPERNNLLDLSRGAMIVSVSSEYANWAGLNLIDGSLQSGWCSGGQAGPHTILIELPQAFTISRVAVDNTEVQEKGYPGISSKGVTVYGSPTSPTTGFEKLAALEAPRSGRQEAVLAKAVTCQWLKFVVASNYGHAKYTEIMELEAYGQPVGPPPKVDVSGVYETTYGRLRLAQKDGSIEGCYYHGKGKMNGNLLGRVMQTEWQEPERNFSGTAILVLSANGSALNGVWYKNGKLAGTWKGKRAEPNPDDCSLAGAGGLGERLASTGKAVVYGIYFDSDSATLKTESETALKEILAVLQAKPELKLQIAGHTDSTQTDAYNLQLSQRRAEAVVKWLADKNIAAARLTPKGFGEAQPVADNGTATGRALNRRVELIRL
jgi:outer membrane protein OmpA-like peptidoglycan-associated protein